MSGWGIFAAVVGGVVGVGALVGGGIYLSRRLPPPASAVQSTSATAASLNPNAGPPYAQPPVSPTSYISDVGDALSGAGTFIDSLANAGVFA